MLAQEKEGPATCDVILRVSSSGRASVFQTEDVGSIPATRSNMLTIVRVWCSNSVVLIWYQDGVMRRDLSVLFSYN